MQHSGDGSRGNGFDVKLDATFLHFPLLAEPGSAILRVNHGKDGEVLVAGRT